ncbi:MAG TPA: hypothetical protein VMT03_21990 [Polyangia bacterium]|nr:hypothetical protein [Polyangia bacterium]
MRRIKECAARWWGRLAIGSVFTLTVAAPAVALANGGTDADAAPPPANTSDMPACLPTDNQLATPETTGMTRQEIREQAGTDYAQGYFQRMTDGSEWYVRGRPYTQGRYQLPSTSHE